MNTPLVHGEGPRKPGPATSARQLESSPAVATGPRPGCRLTFTLAKRVGIAYQPSEPKRPWGSLQTQKSLREGTIEMPHVLKQTLLLLGYGPEGGKNQWY